MRTVDSIYLQSDHILTFLKTLLRCVRHKKVLSKSFHASNTVLCQVGLKNTYTHLTETDLEYRFTCNNNLQFACSDWLKHRYLENSLFVCLYCKF